MTQKQLEYLDAIGTITESLTDLLSEEYPLQKLRLEIAPFYFEGSVPKEPSTIDKIMDGLITIAAYVDTIKN